MAEVAAGALIAEQVIATGVEAAAAVAIAAPTMPLKVSLTQLAWLPQGDSSQGLGRSNHTLTNIGNKAYLFGGETRDGKLCSPDVHAITLPSPNSTSAAEVKHLAYEPFPLQDSETGETYLPAPRTQHAACARGKYLVIHGGRDAEGNPIEEDNCLWLWDTETLRWARLRGETQIGKTMAARYGHRIFVDAEQGFLVLHGGYTKPELKKPDPNIAHSLSDPDTDTRTEAWLYDFNSRAWTTLPRSPAPAVASAYADAALYTISRAADAENLSGVVNHLPLLSSTTEREKPNALAWQTVEFPTNPLTPGPKPREGAALVPLFTGHGRNYLVYMFGCDKASSLEPAQGRPPGTTFYSDIWTLQLPSHSSTAAAAKDVIRDKLPGMESGEFSWGAVDLVPTEQMQPDGKVHPGPRALFGADSCFDGKGVVLWGGVNAKGEKEADGWLLGLAYGYADNDRWE